MSKFVTYESDNSLRKGYFNIFKEIYSEITHNKWLTWQLFKRNFLSSYKQSFLGILWIVIAPFFSLATFILLNRAGIFNLGEINVPYPIYAILGLAFWQLFSAGLISCSGALSGIGGMITKVNFSKKSVIFSTMAQAFVAFLIQFLVVLILFVFYGQMPNVAILLLPLLLLPLLLLTLGLGFMISLVNSFIQDIGKALSGILGLMLFLTPILYARPVTSDFLATMTNYNPIYYLVAMPRQYILFGNISEWRGYLASVIVSVVIFIIGLFVFHLTENRVAERL